MEHLLEVDCDICFIQETFLREGDKAKLAEIRDYGWSVLSNPRKVENIVVAEVLLCYTRTPSH